MGTVLTGAASAVSYSDGRTLSQIALAAYTQAAAKAPCHPDWRDIASIRQIESGSSLGHEAPDGYTTTPAGSPVRGDLNLANPSSGPFQFQPATWAAYQVDGNGDGQVSPDNIYDSALATANMLCAHNWALDRHDAIRAHNGSGPRAEAYADNVLELAGELPDGIKLPAGNLPVASDSHGRYDGVVGRIADDLVGQALDGYAVLSGRARAHAGEAPELAQFFAKADKITASYTGAGGGAAQPAANTGVASSSQMTCPIGGPVEFRQDWGDPRSGGRTHKGNDLFADPGTPIVSPVDGVVDDVVDSEDEGGLGGKSVWVTARGGPLDGYGFYLAHNDRNSVAKGQQVKAGQLVGYVGSTGNARGGPSHVHLQVHPSGGAPVDPYPYTSAACAQNRKAI